MLITNGVLVTWGEPNQILEDHALLIKDGVITDIGPQTALLTRYHEESELDARGQWVMPGNICARLWQQRNNLHQQLFC